MSDLVAPGEIPDGFSAADPTGAAGGGGGGAGGPGGGSGGADSGAAQQRNAQRQSILEQSMTSDALARLRRLKLVKPERVSAVEAMIENMAVKGKLQMRIDDSKLIEMLEGVVGMQARKAGKDAGKIVIQRKKYTFDSDDESDNDDDMY